MATTYSSFVPNIATHVVGCPNGTIEFLVRKVVIDLCNRAPVLVKHIDPFSVNATDFDYSVVTPTDTELVDIIKAELTIPATFTSIPLTTCTPLEAYSIFPTWPDTINTSQPTHIFCEGDGIVNFAPVPDGTVIYNCKLVASLRPTEASTNFDSEVAKRYSRAIFHGVLHEALMIPNTSWTDSKMSLFHGKQWANLVNEAKIRANKGFGRNNISIKQAPW